MKNNLPEGWANVSVGDISKKIHYGYTASSTANDTGFKMLRITDIQDNRVEWDTVPFCEILEKDAVKYLLEEGDLVFARTGATVGKSYLIGSDVPSTVFASYLIRVQLHEGISKKLISYFFNSQLYWNQITANSRGIGQPNVNASVLSTLTLPLPPLAEQRRIVTQLDAVMQKLEASQERLDKLPDLLKKFRQAVLAAAVSGKLTEAWRAEQPQGETGADVLNRIHAERRAQWEDKQRAKLSGKQLSLNDNWKSKYEEPAAPDTSELPELPEGWVWTGFEEIAALEANALKAGPFGSALKKDYYTATGYKIYGQEQVIKQDAHYGNYFISQERYDTLSSCSVKPGDILISLVGTIGKVLILPEDSLPGIINPRLVKLSLDKSTILPEYAKIYLDSPTVKSHFTKVSHGGTMDILNLSILKELPVPLASIDEQEETVRQVNHYFGLADQLEARFEQAAALVEQLPQALLAKAFSGQLVPQDPNDEPASALLERLHAEPAAPAKGKRGRKIKVAADAPLFE
jgi:type I restriction enzyme S subunit